MKKLLLNKVTIVVYLWASSMSQLYAETFTLPTVDVDVVGRLQQIQSRHEETLLDIARRYNLGYREILLANPGVDPWLPGEGTEILLPTRYILPDAPRNGIVLNVSEMRLYHYPEPREGEQPVVITYPVSIGRQDWKTPLGSTRIVSKKADPDWYPPESIREEHAAKGDPLPKKVPAGPDNPLGRYALRLGIPGYLIHGTNKPSGIGMQVSHGCIRMYPEDVETLFKQVPEGTPIHIVDQTYKAGWQGDMLYLEVHPPLIDGTHVKPRNLTPMVRLLLTATKDRPEYKVDWERARSIIDHPLGIPIPLALPQIESDVLEKLPPLGPQTPAARGILNK